MSLARWAAAVAITVLMGAVGAFATPAAAQSTTEPGALVEAVAFVRDDHVVVTVRNLTDGPVDVLRVELWSSGRTIGTAEHARLAARRSTVPTVPADGADDAVDRLTSTS